LTTENNSTPITDTTDLDAFSADFFGTAKPDTPEVDPSNDDADTSSEDDTLATNEAEDTSEAQTDDNEVDDTPVEKPKKQTAQERISELTRARREAERRAEELQRKLEELQTPKSAPATEPEPTVAGAPAPDDVNEDGTDKYALGEFDPAFIADLTRYNINKMYAEKEAEQQQKLAEKAQKQEAEQAVVEWEGRLQEAEKGDIPDIRDKTVTIVEEFSDLDTGYGDYLASVLMSMDKGTQVISYLADNLEEARAIVALGPQKATIALGRIEARFITPEQGKTVKPKVTTAPEPPKQFNRGAGGKFTVPDDTDDLDAFEAKFFALPKK
jgi:hypothetical protein